MTLVAEPPVQITPRAEPLETASLPTLPSEGVRLAQWIRAGCKGTVQAYGVTSVGKIASCAVGALYRGVMGPDAPEAFVIQDLCDTMGIDLMRLVTPPGYGRPMPLYRLIITLNDEYRWSREDIATWLERNV